MKGMGVIFLQEWGEIWTFRSVMGGQPQPRKQYEQMLSSRSKRSEFQSQCASFSEEQEV